MQNSWETGKKQGQPLSRIALIPYYIYSSGKEPQPYLLNF